MYNGKIINELLEQKGVKKNELLKHLGWTCYTQLRQAIEGNPSVKILESIADFFQVPMDTFFEREAEVKGVNIPSEVVNNKELKLQLQVSKERINSMEMLVAEKDKQIALLTEMINLYRQKDSDITTDKL